MTFDELGLSPEILQAISELGYADPTPIQAQAIPFVLMGRDVLGCAQTGTGKTASFTLPMLEILHNGRARARMPRSLILEPTRELATQVAENFEKYGKYINLSMALLIGGESFADQEKKLDRGVDVLIATPGRLIDLFERGKILMSDVKTLVIDEADRMLDMGFIPDVERIVSLLPKLRQTLFFSATMASEIRRLADAFLMNPKEITVAPPATTASTVTQGLTIVDEMDKREALRRLIRAEQVTNALIFCNRKRDVDILYRSLTKHGFNVAQLHGDMPQSKRTETLEKFKRGETALMVCSDVAARGIDIAALSHVFNFDTPIHAEDYVHRIGRTGRAGREGHAYTFATPDDGKHVAAIEKLIGKEIPRITIDGIELLPFEEGDGKGRRRGRHERRKPAGDKAPEGASREGGRDRGRNRRGKNGKSESQEVAAAEIEAAIPHPPVHQGRHEKLESSAALPAVEKAPLEPVRQQNRHERRSAGRRDHDEDTPVLAFGDHMPAFLMRPVRLPNPR
ncbi:DEAD/DEAH box helicase [Dongia soli]|uniref:DEAD/DEAH box helicase n=1 Tax=Dongia soli TaxID=600628 RepID=A0ABU5EGY8_9PROT|nr:DEAD/DEAH box helicase [Dongia soli]MDY0885703.1 DEAD/DEAH box helicase [Dongia soli]